jgi:hypothetical protein
VDRAGAVTLRDRAQLLLTILMHFYGRYDAIKWFDQPREWLGNRTPREAIGQGDIELVETYVRKLGPIKGD